MHELIEAAAPIVTPLVGGTVALYLARAKWFVLRAHKRRGAKGAIPVDLPVQRMDGRPAKLADFHTGRFLTVVFMANVCPGVSAYDGRLAELAKRFHETGVRWLGVNSVAPSLYPSESLEGMRKAAQARTLAFPYVKDAEQTVAKAFGALCTPEVFVLDQAGHIRYAGRIDDAFVAERVKRRYLEEALEALVEGRRVRVGRTLPFGCAIDWYAATPTDAPFDPAAPSVATTT